MEYIIYKPDGKQYDEVKLMDILNYNFRPIEDNTIDIDIDNMKELEVFEYVDEFNEHEVEMNRYEINRLIRAVKQLNKEIKEVKEKVRWK